MKKLSLLLALFTLITISGVCATWYFTTQTVDTTSNELPFSVEEFDYPEIVYITHVDYLSGEGTFTKKYYHESNLESSITVPKGTEISFRITVYNNSRVEQGFDAVVSSLGSGYDNENIIYHLTNLKRPYTLDGILGEDVTRIPSHQTHVFEITFCFADDTTDFSNATLNSILHFAFKPFNEIKPEQFTSPIDGALDAFKNILNTPDSKTILDNVMDQSSGTGAYVGNVVGSPDNDTKVLAELFAGNLNLMLTDPETGELVKTNLTCMIKEEDVDDDNIVDITIYMTPDDLSEKGIFNNDISNVYACVFTQVTVDGTTKWEQIGDLYHGTATCNDYDSNIFNGFDPSINTDSWRSSQVYHNVKKNSKIGAVITGYRKSN